MKNRSTFGLAAGLLAGAALAFTTLSFTSSADAAPIVISGDNDVLIFRDGRRIEGQIIEETESTIRMKVMVGTLAAETTYDKSGILHVMRGTGEAAGDEAKPDDRKVDLTSKPKREQAADGAARVYVMELTGEFGRDISETPIRNAMADARKLNAEYVIVVMDNDWSQALRGGFEENDLGDEVSEFDQLWRAEDMDPIFTSEIAHEWDHEPTIIFWVKQAMGGAAFLPLNCPNIYFHSDARMGGIGNLSTLFGSTGDEVVRQKQYSLRLGHAKGMANVGGYDTRIIEAMCQYEKAFCYKMEGGKAVIYERMPQSADEHLLADDGTENPDTIRDLARGLGNDTLTLDARVARDLGVSKGTVDTLDDLLYELGIERNHVVVSDKAERIMTGWADACDKAEKDMRRLWREVNQIQVAGDYRERTAARGQQKRKIRQIIRLIDQYGEAVNPRAVGVPDKGTLEAIIAQIELDQLADRK